MHSDLSASRKQWYFQPDKLALDKTVMINETVTYLQVEKNPQEKNSRLTYVEGIQ